MTLQKSIVLVKTSINLIDLYEKGTANKWLSDSTRKLRGGGDALATQITRSDKNKAYYIDTANHQNLSNPEIISGPAVGWICLLAETLDAGFHHKECKNPTKA